MSRIAATRTAFLGGWELGEQGNENEEEEAFIRAGSEPRQACSEATSVQGHRRSGPWGHHVA